MEKRRKWISILIDEGLQVGVIKPEDLLRYVTPTVLATDLPPHLVAAILQAGMNEHSFDASLVVKTLGANNLAEHLPLPLLWNCINEAAKVIIQEHPLTKAGVKKNDTLDPEGFEPVRAEEMPEIEVLEE